MGQNLAPHSLRRRRLGCFFVLHIFPGSHLAHCTVSLFECESFPADADIRTTTSLPSKFKSKDFSLGNRSEKLVSLRRTGLCRKLL
ncbi:Vacuolar membrane protease [Trichinella pseudospiralis]